MSEATYCEVPFPVDPSGNFDVTGIFVQTGVGYFDNVNNPTIPAYYNPNGFLFQVGPPPPVQFFNMNGIYSQRFILPMKGTFDRLYAQQQQMNSNLLDPFNQPTQYNSVQQLSYAQQQRYTSLVTLFQKVYTYNLAAYLEAGYKGLIPIYYRFLSSSELTLFREAAALINKLYDVNPNYPLTSMFFMPFPPFCA
jgi:hypothetical protein